MTSEITEAWDDETSFIRDKETQRDRIRRIIKYQKSLCGSSCISSSSLSSQASSTYSSYSISHGNANMLQLMKGGTTSLRRLFHMEYGTGLSTANPTQQWDGNADVENFGSPSSVEESEFTFDVESDGSDGGYKKKELNFVERGKINILGKISKVELLKRLPRLFKRRWRRSKSRLRLGRLGVLICGTKR